MRIDLKDETLPGGRQLRPDADQARSTTRSKSRPAARWSTLTRGEGLLQAISESTGSVWLPHPDLYERLQAGGIASMATAAHVEHGHLTRACLKK